MGAVSSPDLVVAVADAGGVGTLTAMGMTPDALDEHLGTIASRTSGAVAVNFLTDDVDPAAVEVAAARARIVEFFWRDPDASLVELAHRGGAIAGWQVGSVDEARAAVAAGCDFVAAQGSEAGGHVRGETPLLPLLEAVLDDVDVPVLAAGGITTGRGVAAVVGAGAAGARIGTRFVATHESGAHDVYKQAVLAAAGPGATQLTDAFAVCPLCATLPRVRALTSSVDAVRAAGDAPVGEVTLDGRTIPVPAGFGMPPSTAASGKIEAMALYAGAGVDTVRDLRPAGALVEELVAHAAALLGR